MNFKQPFKSVNFPSNNRESILSLLIKSFIDEQKEIII